MCVCDVAQWSAGKGREWPASARTQFRSRSYTGSLGPLPDASSPSRFIPSSPPPRRRLAPRRRRPRCSSSTGNDPTLTPGHLALSRDGQLPFPHPGPSISAKLAHAHTTLPFPTPTTPTTTLSMTQLLDEEDLTSSPPPHQPHSQSTPTQQHTQTQKFPHTRAFLASLARQYRPDDGTPVTSVVGTGALSSDGESEGEKADPIVALGGNDFVRSIVGYLRDEDEDELRNTLKDCYSTETNDFDANIDQHVLNLMHKHRDDLSGVPFAFLTPVKRPVSRPSSRASTHSVRRPETPTLLAQSGRTSSFSRRPHTPVSASRLTSVLLASGDESDSAPSLGGPSSVFSDSPTPSPRMGSVRMPAARPLLPTSLSSSDLAASPGTSPRFLNTLNAKAVEFRPGARPLSAASGSFTGPQTPPTLNTDMWAHNPEPSSAGPLTPSFSSNLAIAAPLLPDSPAASPLSATFASDSDIRLPPPPKTTSTSNTSAANTTTTSGTQPRPIGNRRPRSDTLDDEQFSPFFTGSNGSSSNVPYGCSPYDPDSILSSSSNSASSPSRSFDVAPMSSFNSMDDTGEYIMITSKNHGNGTHGHNNNGHGMNDSPPSDDEIGQLPMHMMMLMDDDMLPPLGPGQGGEDDDMTPLEMLLQMFGSTTSAQELEDALQQNGYDFDASIAWLVDRQGGGPMPSLQPAQAIHQHQGQGPQSMYGRAHSGRVLVVPREEYQQHGMRTMAGNGRLSPRYGPPRPAGVGNRVCRYFLQGECRRADCRFSHDLDRALCRFWLRGQCAKGEQCEFVHQLPPDTDNSYGSRFADRSSPSPYRGRDARDSPPPGEEFPQLRRGSVPYHHGSGRPFDPARSRFAQAVKRIPQGNSAYGTQTAVTGGRFAVAHSQHRASPSMSSEYGGPGYSRAVPRASPRLRLRPPSLLPTVPTGKSVSDLYNAYRNHAQQLAGSRNAALTRAAAAWQRHDGASAKHFSRQAQDYNLKMAAELADAAGKLVKERSRIAVDAVRNRDPAWSDDPLDRTWRGKPCGSQLGVVLGVCSAGAAGMGGGGAALTAEERMECLLDLHGLHANEAIEVLEDFLSGLERERYLGLAYLLVGEEKHTGTQDPNRGISKLRLAAGVKDYLHQYSFPWSERDGIICVDPLTHAE